MRKKIKQTLSGNFKFEHFSHSFDDLDDDDLNRDDDASEVDMEGGAEEEPLNSEDDVSDEDAADLFETDNVVVCQYDKVSNFPDFPLPIFLTFLLRLRLTDLATSGSFTSKMAS